MATERMAMRKIREFLRLRWQLGLTVREAARSLGVSLGVVSKMGARATTADLTWVMDDNYFCRSCCLAKDCYRRAPAR